MTAVMPGSNPLVAVAFISRLSGLAQAAVVQEECQQHKPFLVLALILAEAVEAAQCPVVFTMPSLSLHH